MNKDQKAAIKEFWKAIKKMDESDVDIVIQGLIQSFDFIAKEKFPDWENVKKEYGL